ncbi:hypothetical protein MHU86_18036 [Fragilaria crotonensis]|nr:hypothetical protein MHU86_18036 [Fragilaria crotonensis]
MKSIRQRKADPSPSSRGTKSHPQEETVRIVIEQKVDRLNDHVEGDDLDLHSYHSTPPQPLRMIPDMRYSEFLQGQTSNRIDVSAFLTGPQCACHCIAFSWIAVAFLLWVGFLIDTQPIFIKGVQPKGIFAIEGVTFNVRTEDQRLPACATAYHTAYAYLVTILLCFAYRRNWFQLLASRLPIRLLRRRYTYCNQMPPEER